MTLILVGSNILLLSDSKWADSYNETSVCFFDERCKVMTNPCYTTECDAFHNDQTKKPPIKRSVVSFYWKGSYWLNITRAVCILTRCLHFLVAHEIEDVLSIYACNSCSLPVWNLMFLLNFCGVMQTVLVCIIKVEKSQVEMCPLPCVYAENDCGI